MHGILFIRTKNEGIYNLPKNGDDFEYMSLKGYRIFVLSHNKITESIFAETGPGIFRTRNQGKSWENGR